MNKSKIISLTVMGLLVTVITAVIFSRQSRMNKAQSNIAISQVGNPKAEILKRLEEALRANEIADVSVAATEPFVVPGVSDQKPEDGLYAVISITGSVDSLAAYFDYNWHRSIAMREAVLISQNNPAPLLLGEIRVFNRSGQLIDTSYCGGALQPTYETKYFTEVPTSKISDEETRKLLMDGLKDYPDVTIKEIRVRSGGPAAKGQSAEVFLTVKSWDDPRYGLGIALPLLKASANLNRTQLSSLTYFRVRVESEQGEPVAQVVMDPGMRMTTWGYTDGIKDPDPPGPTGIGTILYEFSP